MKPRKPIKRKGRPRFPKGVDQEYRAWIRTWACCLRLSFDCQGRVVCAHVKSRGAGGGDLGNIVPMCWAHHAEQHRMGIKSFGNHYGLDLAECGLDLAEMAGDYLVVYLKNRPSCPHDATNPLGR